MLRIQGLRVRRRGFKVCIEDLELAPGSIVLAGANGSGKSTTLQALSGMLRYEGSWSLDGKDANARLIAKQVAYLPQEPAGLDHLSFSDALKYAGSLFKVKDAHASLDRLNLNHLASKKLRDMSGGERHLAYLSLILMRKPRVVLLDEPTAGIDADNRILIRRTVRESLQGCIVVTTTHLPEDVAVLGDRTLVMSSGSIVFDGDVETLRSHGSSQSLDDASDLEVALATLGRQ